MDLHFGDSKPTDDERAAVDALLGPPESSWEGADRSDADLRWARGGREARDRRDLLLPGLHAVNDRIGWISEGALDYLCRLAIRVILFPVVPVTLSRISSPPTVPS